MDRYVKVVLTVIAAALVVIAVRPWTPAVLDRVVPGPAQAQTPTAKYDVAIPKGWGKYLAYSNNNLLLEAPTARCASSTSRARRPSTRR